MIWTRWILYGISLPFSLVVSLPLLIVLRVLRLVDNVRFSPDFIVAADITLRGARFWRYSTTIGRLILFHPDVYMFAQAQQVLAHERVHVRQHEDLMFVGWQLSVLFGPLLFNSAWWAGFLLWTSAGLWPLLMYLTSALRYGMRHAYDGAEHERAAYAQTDFLPGDMESWLETHERVMRSGP